MTGLRLMNQIMDPATREEVLAAPPSRTAVPEEIRPQAARGCLRGERAASKVRADVPIPAAPYLDRKVRDVPQLAEIWSYINPYMLYGRHLGFKGNFEKRLAERDAKALELFHNMEEVKRWAAGFMKVRAVWQFFEAERDGNSIHLFEPAEPVRCTTFHFGRQAEGGRPLPERLRPGS